MLLHCITYDKMHGTYQRTTSKLDRLDWLTALIDLTDLTDCLTDLDKKLILPREQLTFDLTYLDIDQGTPIMTGPVSVVGCQGHPLWYATSL